MGRQLIASVLYIINEVEVSIYSLLSLEAKKTKKQSQPVELGGSIAILAVVAFNALAGYRCLDWTSTGG